MFLLCKEDSHDIDSDFVSRAQDQSKNMKDMHSHEPRRSMLNDNWGDRDAGDRLEIDRDIAEYRKSLIRVSKRLSDAKDQVNDVVNSALVSEDLYNTLMFVKSALNTLKITYEYKAIHMQVSERLIAQAGESIRSDSNDQIVLAQTTAEDNVRRLTEQIRWHTAQVEQSIGIIRTSETKKLKAEMEIVGRS